MRSRRAPAQSLVEFAALAPVLLLLAVAVWDGGGLLREQLILDGAARAGARLAATGYGTITQTEVVNAVLAAGSDLQLGAADQVTVTTVDPSTKTVIPGTVTVSVTHQHPLYTPILRRLWGDGSGAVTLTGQAQFFVPAAGPPRVPVAPPPAPCTFDVKIPPLDNKEGWFSPPFQLATRADPGYFVNRVLVYWVATPSGNPIKNLVLALYAGNPFAGMSNPIYSNSKPSGALVTDDKTGGPSLALSFDLTSPTTTAGSTYTAYFYNFGAALSDATVGTVTFLGVGCP